MSKTIDLTRSENHGIPTESIRTFLDQLVDIDGDEVIEAEGEVKNCSGRVEGHWVQVSDETWQTIWECHELDRPMLEAEEAEKAYQASLEAEREEKAWQEFFGA